MGTRTPTHTMGNSTGRQNNDNPLLTGSLYTSVTWRRCPVCDVCLVAGSSASGCEQCGGLTYWPVEDVLIYCKKQKDRILVTGQMSRIKLNPGFGEVRSVLPWSVCIFC